MDFRSLNRISRSTLNLNPSEITAQKQAPQIKLFCLGSAVKLFALAFHPRLKNNLVFLGTPSTSYRKESSRWFSRKINWYFYNKKCSQYLFFLGRKLDDPYSRLSFFKWFPVSSLRIKYTSEQTNKIRTFWLRLFEKIHLGTILFPAWRQPILAILTSIWEIEANFSLQNPR